MHMNTINIIKQKQQNYTMLLINCQKRLQDNELKEIEQELMKSIVIENSPPYKFKEFLIFVIVIFYRKLKN